MHRFLCGLFLTATMVAAGVSQAKAPPPCTAPACSVVAQMAPWPTKPAAGMEVLSGPHLAFSLPSAPQRLAHNLGFLGFRFDPSSALLLESIRFEELTDHTVPENVAAILKAAFEHSPHSVESSYPGHVALVRNFLHYKSGLGFTQLKSAKRGDLSIYWGQTAKGWTAIAVNAQTNSGILEITGRGMAATEFDQILASLHIRK